jgi:hypothetical protein
VATSENSSSDSAIDTSVAYSDGSITGSVAKACSFRGAALIVPMGVDAGLVSVALRGRGIFVEGPITVPPAGAELEREQEPESEREERRRAEDQRYPKAAIEEQRRQRRE